MNKILITTASCLWVALFLLLIVYEFPTPRHFVLRTLVSKEGADQESRSALRLLAAVGPASVPSVADQPGNTYDYKLLQNVDPCTLSQLGDEGWTVNQLGGNLVSEGTLAGP